MNAVKIGARVLFSAGEVERLARRGCSLTEAEKQAATRRNQDQAQRADSGECEDRPSTPAAEVDKRSAPRYRGHLVSEHTRAPKPDAAGDPSSSKRSDGVTNSEAPTGAAATDNAPQFFVHRSGAEAAFAQVPKEERGGSWCPPKTAQSQSADAKPSIEIPGDLSIPPFLRREQPKPQQPADATKPNGSLPPQHDEQAQDAGFAAPQQRVQSAAEKLSGGQAPQRDALAQDDIAASARHVQPATDELNGRQVRQQQVLAQDDYIAAPQHCVQPAVDDIAMSPARNEPAPNVGFAAPQHREQPLRIDQQAHDPSPRFDHAMALRVLQRHQAQWSRLRLHEWPPRRRC